MVDHAKRRGRRAIEALNADFDRLREAGDRGGGGQHRLRAEQATYAAKLALPFLLL